MFRVLNNESKKLTKSTEYSMHVKKTSFKLKCMTHYNQKIGISNSTKTGIGKNIGVDTCPVFISD